MPEGMHPPPAHWTRCPWPGLPARGTPRRAAQLGGAAETLRETLGAPLLPEQRVDDSQAVQAMRATLSESALRRPGPRGALPLEAAIALALEQGQDNLEDRESQLPTDSRFA